MVNSAEIKVLNLYAGLGGNRSKWENVKVTAVEMDARVASVYADRFPLDKIIIGDALQYLLNHFFEFDFIWASPPCQSHGRMAVSGRNRKPKFIDMSLWQIILFLKRYHKGLYVVENVTTHYDPLIRPSKVLDRHYFWCNFPVSHFEGPKAPGGIFSLDVEALKKWLGIDYPGNIYLKTNDPRQVLRNCVHPLLGEHVFNQGVKYRDAGNVTAIPGPGFLPPQDHGQRELIFK